MGDAPEPRFPQDEVTPEKRIAFHMAEFNAIKSAVSDLEKAAAANLQYALLASGGIFTWLAAAKRPASGTNEAPIFPVDVRWLGLLWFVPLGIAVLFGGLSLVQYLYIRQRSHYIRRIERQLAFGGFGFEDKFSRRPRSIGWYYGVIWLALILADGAVALLLSPAAEELAPAIMREALPR